MLLARLQVQLSDPDLGSRPKVQSEIGNRFRGSAGNANQGYGYVDIYIDIWNELKEEVVLAVSTKDMDMWIYILIYGMS